MFCDLEQTTTSKGEGRQSWCPLLLSDAPQPPVRAPPYPTTGHPNAPFWRPTHAIFLYYRHHHKNIYKNQSSNFGTSQPNILCTIPPINSDHSSTRERNRFILYWTRRRYLCMPLQIYLLTQWCEWKCWCHVPTKIDRLFDPPPSNYNKI